MAISKELGIIVKTFWLKMAGLAVVVVVGLIILVGVFSTSEPEPEPEPEAKPKTFWGQVEQDDKELRAEPEVKQPLRNEQVVEESKPRAQFKELSLEDKVQAGKLFEMALAQRKIGRLPGMSYKLMVDYCRQIIKEFPDSEYAFKARRMLADIPERYRKQYNITDEEMGL